MSIFLKIKNWYKENFSDLKVIPFSEIDSLLRNGQNINPATGLPINDSGIDINGNPNGISLNHNTGSPVEIYVSNEPNSIVVNPTSGFPMVDSGMDVCGNSYGSNNN